MHREFAPIAFISAFSVLLVLPWHWRAGNVATLAITFWLFTANMIYGVDAAVWGDNARIAIPVWCDITTKLIIGSSFGLPAACLCISINLESIASVRQAKSTISDKRRRRIFEALMSFGLPVLFMGLHFVVQGHRFDVIEEYGCRPTTYFSIPAIFIIWLPPLLLSTASLIYAGLALRHFMIRRISFSAHLHASQSSLTMSRYLRLMLMAILQMLWGVTTTAYALWFTVMAVPIRPWTTWDDVHSNFSRIDQYPKVLTPRQVLTSYYVLWWIVPISTVIFVMFFAFGRDATEEYMKCFVWFRTRILRQATSSESAKGSFIDMATSKWSLSKTVDSSKTATTTVISTLPYGTTAPPSPGQLKADFDNDSCSEVPSPSRESSYSPDRHSATSPTETLVALPSPLVIPTTQEHHHHAQATISLSSSPLPPPPRHPHFRALLTGQQSLISSRPFTYPSNDASHRELANYN